MSNDGITRRDLVGGAAGLTCGAAIGGLLAAPVLANTAPFPTLSRGRLTPATLADYERAMMSGGPGKDGIPAIDGPRFWSAGEADTFLDDADVVFGVVEGGVARAYPQRLLVWHEIVNDVIGDVGLAVTYCPLTGTAIGFERARTEFGVSGRLVNSNLVMYDRDTDTWFPQILAVGIRGPHAGQALVERPLVWTRWERWRDRYPETAVLSTQTGFARNYTRDPYGGYNPPSGYYGGGGTMFPPMHDDDRFPAKSVFVGARTEDAAVAFALNELRRAGRLEIEAGGQTYTAIHDEALDTGYVFRGRAGADARVEGFGPEGVVWSGDDAPEPLNTFQAMWFAWAAFYPETAVHG